MFACFPLLLPLFTQSCSFSLAVKTPRWNSTFCLCTKTLDVEEKKREKSDKHWAHVHNIWRGKGKREKTLRTNCCFSEKAETLLFFSCCRFIIIFRFSSPFSRINISIIEPSWFWCCHVTAFVVLRAKIADNFLRDEIILRLVTNRNIFFQFFATLVLLLAENGKKSLLRRVNICSASNFLVLQEVSENFQSKLIRQKKVRWEREGSAWDSSRLVVTLKWKIGVIWGRGKSYHVSCCRRQNNEQSLKALICWLISSSFVICYCFSRLYISINWGGKW